VALPLAGTVGWLCSCYVLILVWSPRYGGNSLWKAVTEVNVVRLKQGWGTYLLPRAARVVLYGWRAAKSINFILKFYHYLTMRKSVFS